MLVNVKDQEMLNFIKLIENKSFDAAEKLIRDKNSSKNILDYNLGFLEYSKGNLVVARKHLEKAKFSGMISDEVEGALKVVRTELDLVYTEADISEFDNFVLNSASLPSQFYPTISIITLIVCMTFFVMKRKVMSTVLGLIGISFFVIFLGIKDFQVNYNLTENIIYRGPSRIFEEKQVLLPGAKVIFSKKVDDWKYIKYPSIYEGWIYKNKAI
jgi:hypothetical protein